MKIAPNPAQHQIQIVTPDNRSMDLNIYHISGKLIRTISNYQNRQFVDIQELPAGTYLATLRDTEGMQYQKKFVKQ